MVPLFLQVVQLTNYPLYAYLTTKLAATQLDKASHLRKQFFIEDTTGYYDDTSVHAKGFRERREFFGNDVPQSGGDQFVYDNEDHTFCGILKTPLPDINFVPTPSTILIGKLGKFPQEIPQGTTLTR